MIFKKNINKYLHRKNIFFFCEICILSLSAESPLFTLPVTGKAPFYRATQSKFIFIYLYFFPK